LFNQPLLYATEYSIVPPATPPSRMPLPVVAVAPHTPGLLYATQFATYTVRCVFGTAAYVKMPPRALSCASMCVRYTARNPLPPFAPPMTTP